MPCFANILPVSTLQKLFKSVKIWQSCSQMYTATFYESRQKCRFWFFQVRCAHKSDDVINFTTVACRISSRSKWYKTILKNRLRVAKVIVKNKMSRFMVHCIVLKTFDFIVMRVWLEYAYSHPFWPLRSFWRQKWEKRKLFAVWYLWENNNRNWPPLNQKV